MTPLIRSMVKALAAEGGDPTELHWFDMTGQVGVQVAVAQDPLRDFRPPFDRCCVVFSGQAPTLGRVEMHMITAGADPEEGVILSVWRKPAGRPLVASPALVYVVDDGIVRYGPATDDAPSVREDEARMILGFASAWLGALSRRAEAYVPSVSQTWTARRKAASGKVPSYEWRTVIVEPASVRRPHQGGTHASPRQHDRRGHLRRLRSGKQVWVRDCKVGDPSRGAVFHDYAMGAAA